MGKVESYLHQLRPIVAVDPYQIEVMKAVLQDNCAGGQIRLGLPRVRPSGQVREEVPNRIDHHCPSCFASVPWFDSQFWFPD